jgi:ketosteroid isomerase-like protein
MTRPRLLFSSLLSLATAILGQAAQDDDAAHAALRQLKTTYETAIRLGDLAPLRSLFTPETSAVMILGQEIRSFAELESHWAYVRNLIGPGGTYTTTLKPELSLIYGDTAVARGESDEVVRTAAGKEYRFTSRWTAIGRRVGGEWKIVRLHGSMDPVNNVFVAAFLSGAKLTYGVGGLVVGAVLGAGAMFLLRRRSTAA